MYVKCHFHKYKCDRFRTSIHHFPPSKYLFELVKLLSLSQHKNTTIKHLKRIASHLNMKYSDTGIYCLDKYYCLCWRLQ